MNHVPPTLLSIADELGKEKSLCNHPCSHLAIKELREFNCEFAKLHLKTLANFCKDDVLKTRIQFMYYRVDHISEMIKSLHEIVQRFEKFCEKWGPDSRKDVIAALLFQTDDTNTQPST